MVIKIFPPDVAAQAREGDVLVLRDENWMVDPETTSKRKEKPKN